MKDISADTEMCFNRYSNAMKSIHIIKQQEREEPPTEAPILLQLDDFVTGKKLTQTNSVIYEVYRRRKREEAIVDEGIKNVCW